MSPFTIGNSQSQTANSGKKTRIIPVGGRIFPSQNSNVGVGDSNTGYEDRTVEAGDRNIPVENACVISELLSTGVPQNSFLTDSLFLTELTEFLNRRSQTLVRRSQFS
jgi:hypothetical protein